MDLPRKPSELIRLALSDLAKCEADPRYMIEMGTWHEPKGKVCHVCLAGSVMAQTMGTFSDSGTSPCWHAHEETQLIALDSLRTGDVSLAFDDLNLGEPPIENREITPYEEDSDAFRVEMEELANDLKKAGL